jgi:hypothetical protein
MDAARTSGAAPPRRNGGKPTESPEQGPEILSAPSRNSCAAGVFSTAPLYLGDWGSRVQISALRPPSNHFKSAPTLARVGEHPGWRSVKHVAQADFPSCLGS